MKYLVSGDEMKILDQTTSEYFHVPTVVLMERAALAFVEVLEQQIKINKNSRVLVVCGNGNNGADGIAIARLLNQKGISTDIYLIKQDYVKDSDVGTQLYKLQKNIYLEYGYGYVKDLTKSIQYDFIIEAIFGIGLSREINGNIKDLLSFLNAYNCQKIAVDMPAGISADTGKILGIAFRSDFTITFGFGKIGQFLWPGTEYCGKVFIADMGITIESAIEKLPQIKVMELEDLRSLPKRTPHSNKGSYGKLLIVAGCVNMAGAAILAARAAFASGIGLVKICTPEENRIIIQSTIPEAILVTYSKDAVFDNNQLENEIEWSDAIVIGPGIGKDKAAHELVDLFLMKTDKPMVVDADALNIISENPAKYQKLLKNKIITPHLGEMSRMIKKSVGNIQENLLDTAIQCADNLNAICVLKDFHTVIATTDGSGYLNLSGNNGMATAGSGDVLSGIIGALLANKISKEQAAAFGVFIHGLAGDAMQEYTGTHAMMANDIINGLKIIWKQVEQDGYK